MFDKNFKEKREYIRMEMDTEISIRNPENGKAIIGRCLNLSHSGIKIETSSEAQIGTKFEVFLNTSNTNFEPLKAIVKVLRIEQEGKDKSIIAGKILRYLSD